MKAKIHSLEEGFLDDIARIEAETFRDPWSRQSYADELKNPNAVYRVITLDGAPVAYAGFWKIFDEGHITNVAVDKKYRRQGLGRMLMEDLIECARSEGIRAMTLEVRASNEGAIRLYESFGFVSAGVRKNYYPDGEGAVIMWLEEI